MEFDQRKKKEEKKGRKASDHTSRGVVDEGRSEGKRRSSIHFLLDSTLVRCFTSWLCLLFLLFFYFITSSIFCSFGFKFSPFLNSFSVICNKYIYSIFFHQIAKYLYYSTSFKDRNFYKFTDIKIVRRRKNRHNSTDKLII